jgi:hypothetical protein
MSGWWIKPQDGMVVLDDALMVGIDCSSIPSNIYLVRWYNEDGEICYNHDDRLAVRDKFTDISPYIPIFNKWLEAAKDNPPDPCPPISIAQAKLIKSEMVDFLFTSKRQLPLDYAPPSVGVTYTWDGSDNATSAMSDEIAALSGTDAINAAVGNLAASTTEAIASLTASTNETFAQSRSNTEGALGTLAGDVTAETNAGLSASAGSATTAIKNSIDSVNAATGTYAGQLADANHTGVLLQGLNTTGSPGAAPYSHTDAINTLVQRIIDGATPIYTTGQISFPHPDMGAGTPDTAHPGSVAVSGPTVAPVNTITPPVVSPTPASGPDITWPPIGAPPVTMHYTEFTQLLALLTGRRRTLQIRRTQHKNNIAAMTTIDAVIAYDITTGW